MPAIADLSYHTTGMLYDKRNDILMAIFGQTQGCKLWKNENDVSQGHIPFSPDMVTHTKLMMARSCDNGETWKLFILYDYKENDSPCVFHAGITGCGVQVGDETFAPQIRMACVEKNGAIRYEVALLRIRNLNRQNNADSFEFENDFRMLASSSEQDIRYADETVYLQKMDRTGFLSFHRPTEGMPTRREYDNNHNPTSDFIRVQSRGFDPRDYNPGVHGPKIIAFNITRMPDGNLMMASRFYGTDHHQAGNIFMTSKNEGLTWDYDDDQIPYQLKPLLFEPVGNGGNPSMSYMPDASLVHTTSAGCGLSLEDSQRVIGSTFVNRFQGMVIEKKEAGPGLIAVSIDVSEVVGLAPIYVASATVTDKKSMEFEHVYEDNAAINYSADRRKISFVGKVMGPAPLVKLKVVFANKANGYRPSFEPTLML